MELVTFLSLVRDTQSLAGNVITRDTLVDNAEVGVERENGVA